MENNEHIEALFRKYLANEHSAEELDELLLYVKLTTDDGPIDQLISQALDSMPQADQQREIQGLSDRIAPRIFNKTRPRVKKLYLRLLFRAAALLIIGFGIFFMVRKSESPEDRKKAMITDIAPGYNQATLTLADGIMINLDSSKAGIQINDEDINYNDGTASEARIHHSSSITHNSLTTPKGGQYQIILPDGTKVWLNAASTLKYPSRFSGDSRVVELEGEAYFSVDSRQSSVVSQKTSAGDRVPRVPFIVKSRGQDIKVLGTEFNIAAYADETSVKTTLINGAVQVVGHKGNFAGTSGLSDPGLLDLKILKPGQQSIISAAGIQIKNVDAEAIAAWKDGTYIFHDTSLKAVMKQLSRWYDVDVDVSVLPNKQFAGMLQRDAKLSEILTVIEAETGLKFNIIGRRLIIEK